MRPESNPRSHKIYRFFESIGTICYGLLHTSEEVEVYTKIRISIYVRFGVCVYPTRQSHTQSKYEFRLLHTEFVTLIPKNIRRHHEPILKSQELNLQTHSSFKFYRKTLAPRYRVPMEAEWEYAAQAGSTMTNFFGNDETDMEQYVWYNKNLEGQASSRRSKKPNAWGLHDILGGDFGTCFQYNSEIKII